jgi:hemolysin D
VRPDEEGIATASKAVQAELSYVSPDAQEDQKIGLVYKIKLKSKRFFIRVKDKDISITPGIAVTAEIKTRFKKGIVWRVKKSIR